jgi:hypothetical protein
VTKRDFFKLFWPAWNKAFTGKNVLSAFLKTGIYPLDQAAILSAPAEAPADKSSRPPTNSSSGSSVIPSSDWHKLNQLLKKVCYEVVSETHSKEVRKLEKTVATISGENALLKAQLTGLQEAFNHEKKRRKRGKALFEEIRAADGQGATFFSPQKIQQAFDLRQQRDDAKQAIEHDKAVKAAAKKEEQLSKQAAIEQRRIERLQKRQQRADAAQAKVTAKEEAKIDQQLTNQLQTDIAAVSKTRRKPQRAPAVTTTDIEPLKEPLHHVVEIPANQVTRRTTRQPKHLQGYVVY